MGHPVVHFEIAGRDGDRLEGFYRDLFGWSIERRETGGHPYGFVAHGDAGAIGGGIRHEPEGRPEIVLYVEVPDLEAAVESARKLGATVRIPPMRTPELTFALVSDPEGNPVGLIQKKTEGPGGSR